MSFTQPAFWASTYRRRTPLRWTQKVVIQPVIEPITLGELKVAARIDSDDENAVLDQYIRAARDTVEQDTALALLTQTREIYFDQAPGIYDPFSLPYPPLQAVEWVKSTATDGTVTTVDAAEYLVTDGTISLGDLGEWPTGQRVVRPWSMRIRVGHLTVDDIPPSLVQAVRLLAVHFATAGRDMMPSANVSALAMRPMTYEDCIAPHRQIVLA